MIWGLLGYTADGCGRIVCILQKGDCGGESDAEEGAC